MEGAFSRAGRELLRKQAEDLERVLSEGGEDPELLFRLGVIRVRLGEVENARRVFLRLREIDPERASELLDIIYDL